MKKVRPWELWDWKSIKRFIIVAIFLCGAFFIFDHIPDWVRNSANKTMTETTDGKFVRAEYIKRYSQGRFGNREVVTGILIEYSYSINGKIYNSHAQVYCS